MAFVMVSKFRFFDLCRIPFIDDAEDDVRKLL